MEGVCEGPTAGCEHGRTGLSQIIWRSQLPLSTLIIFHKALLPSPPLPYFPSLIFVPTTSLSTWIIFDSYTFPSEKPHIHENNLSFATMTCVFFPLLLYVGVIFSFSSGKCFFFLIFQLLSCLSSAEPLKAQFCCHTLHDETLLHMLSCRTHQPARG